MRGSNMKPILRRNTSHGINVRCMDCFNYDKTRQVGYTCLILGLSKKPSKLDPCFYFIHKTQTKLGTVGAP